MFCIAGVATNHDLRQAPTYTSLLIPFEMRKNFSQASLNYIMWVKLRKDFTKNAMHIVTALLDERHGLVLRFINFCTRHFDNHWDST